MNSTTDEIDLNDLRETLAGLWSIEHEIGRGGMATVFLARDVALDRPVALKVLHPALARDADACERFLAEARTGAKLSHPNIVPIYAVESRGGFVYFVMGLVDGETLGERIRREGPVRHEEAERMLREVGWALGYAHAMGLVHRDVTVENILLERSTGRAVLADFGIAAEISREGAGPLMGTPAYLAPEVIQGEAATPQSDLYALGVVAWSMLSGRPPFLGDNSAEVLLKHLNEPTPSLASASPATPSRMVRAVEAAMAKDPAQRAGGIEQWLNLFDVEGASVSLANPLRRWLQGWESMRPFYALGAMYVGIMSSAILPFDWNAAYRSSVTVMMVFPVVMLIHLGAKFGQLRRASRAGYGATDLQLALMQERHEIRHQRARQAPLTGRIARLLRWAAVLALIVIGLLVTNEQLRIWYRGGGVPGMLQIVRLVTRWSVKAAWLTLSFNFLVPGYLLKADGLVYRLRTVFWGSRFARVWLRMIAFGLPTRRAAIETLHRPTELVLDLAIEDLWEALPAGTRKRIPGIPALVESLRRKVSELKQMIHLIDASHRTHPEARAIRQQLIDRQDAGLTALERLRLMLGKLGGAMRTEDEFSQQLVSAREVEQGLLEELGAHKDLMKILKRRSAKRSVVSLTPTPVQ